MFEKFGELDSADVINELADNLYNEGDIEGIKALAEENGIDLEVVELYTNQEIPGIADPLMAALGKIDVECKELQIKEIMSDWVEYIKGQCNQHEEMAIAVRKTGKSLKGCIAKLLMWSFKNQQKVDAEILKEAKINGARVTLGIPGMQTAKRLIREYYMGGGEDAKG